MQVKGKENDVKVEFHRPYQGFPYGYSDQYKSQKAKDDEKVTMKLPEIFLASFFQHQWQKFPVKRPVSPEIPERI